MDGDEYALYDAPILLGGDDRMDKTRLEALIVATRRGWPMTWKTLIGGLQAIFTVAAIVGLIALAAGINAIDNSILRGIAWALWGIFVAFVGIVIGLTPYRGQKAITDERDLELRSLSPLKDKQEDQEAHPEHYIWAVLRPVDLQGVGPNSGDTDHFSLGLRLVSGLFQPLPFLTIRGEIKMARGLMGWSVNFNSSGPNRLEYNKKWSGEGTVSLAGSALATLHSRVNNHESMSLDVVISLPDAKEIRIKDVQQAEPHYEGHLDELFPGAMTQ